MGARKWPTLNEARARAVRTYLERTLERAGGNISQLARLAGRNRTEMYRLLERHGLRSANRASAQSNPRMRRGRWGELES